MPRSRPLPSSILQIRQQSYHRVFESRQILLDEIPPHQVNPHDVVLVYQDIAEAGGVAPGDLRVPCS